MPPDETVTEMYLRVCERMKSAGYEHYEVSNFAKPGYRSRHNSNYWKIESSYLGLGPGAHGYLRGSGRFRYEMIRDPQKWMKDETGVGTFEALTMEQTKLEDFYLHLRTRKPLDLPQNPSLLRDLTREGLIEVIEGQGFVATERGWLVIESLAQTLASN
jgi:oxygen-independent coproporphyrinogen-3 oxidase